MLQSQLKSLESNISKELTAPKKVCWNMTSRCNLKCKFCLGPQNFTKELDTEQAKEVIRKLYYAGVERIVLSGGEALLRKDLSELLEFAARIGLKVSLATNGFLLNKEFISGYGKYLELVEISLDGANPETEQAMREKKGLFDHIIANLKLLEKNGVAIKINTMVSKKNYENIAGIGEIAQKFNARCWKIFQFVPRNRGKKFRKEFEISNAEFNNLKNRINGKFPKLNIIWAPKDYFSRAYFNIYPDGSVCVPKTTSETIIGNILTSQVEELWQNSLFDKSKHLQETSNPNDS